MLTEPQIIEIANQLASGATTAAVAQNFGVTRQRIYQIIKKHGFVIVHRPNATERRAAELERKRGFDEKTWQELRKLGAQRAFNSQRQNARVRGIA